MARICNIIIFRAEQSKKTNPEQRKAEDIAIVNEHSGNKPASTVVPIVSYGMAVTFLSYDIWCVAVLS